MKNKNIILDINNLKIHYKTDKGNVYAVDGVDIQLKEGESLGLVGESGCGKTTVIKSILQILPKNGQSEGTINFKGTNLINLSNKEMRKIRGAHISTISQSAMNALDPVYKVGNQFVEAIRVHRKISKKKAWIRAEELFDLVGIDSRRLHDYPHQFSGGMRQRAIIAMSLVLNPEIVVADEPTTALDVVVQAQILSRIKNLQKELNSSMIMVTHDMSVIAETCQKVVVMYAGKVVEAGPVESIFNKPSHPYTMGLKNAFPNIKSDKFDLISIPGYPPNLIDPPSGCRFADRCPFATELCKVEEPELKEISKSHISACHYVDNVKEMRNKATFKKTWNFSKVGDRNGKN